ncbi:hypothetical protein D9757_003410 [Collybiopsis confluens]|uniref:Mitochondrial K+-H+ exchange-related-domain-containing protein n=1 Tax=Collybiopsis confluens TaxID=2823264 RepID=A0A8H5MD09_9AGAR|nr:hypothetical protein D9757_003410 [Collybiopsis confluens]
MKSLHSVQRIISLPITRPRNSIDVQRRNGGQGFTYHQFQLHIKSADLDNKQSTKGGWIQRAQTKASSTWASFGKAPEGNWKLRLFRAGERIIDRLDYEELALKGVNPSLGPTIRNPEVQGKGPEEAKKIIISLLYPPSIQSGDVSLGELRELVQTRESKHRKGFWMWMIIAPFTAPFMIIPVIPNIPFFFCAWRSWSHYLSYRASQYLSNLIKHGQIVSTPSTELDAIYKQYSVKTLTASPTQSDSSSKMLLTREAVPAVLSTFLLDDSSASDMYRAIEQARVRSQLPP